MCSTLRWVGWTRSITTTLNLQACSCRTTLRFLGDFLGVMPAACSVIHLEYVVQKFGVVSRLPVLAVATRCTASVTTQ